jgi:hypothetical protein
MFVVDTDILVYATIEECPEHSRARRCVDVWRREALPWHSTWGVFYEFLRVTTHPRVFRRPLAAKQARRFLAALLDAPTFTLLVETPRHATIVATLCDSIADLRGNLWHDAHTAALMIEHGVSEIRTADADFGRFAQLRCVNPLAA